MIVNMYDVVDCSTGDYFIRMAGVREIAVLLGCNEGTVYNGINNARKVLHHYYIEPCLARDGKPIKGHVEKLPVYEDIKWKLVKCSDVEEKPVKKADKKPQNPRFYRTSAGGGYWL